MSRIRTLLYSTAVVFALYSAVKRVINNFVTHQRLSTTMQSFMPCTKMLMVGIKRNITTLHVYRNPKQQTRIDQGVEYVLWPETATKNRDVVSAELEYIAGHVSDDLKKLLVIEEAYLIVEKNPDNVRLVRMENTRVRRLDDYHALSRIGALMSAGRIIREAMKRPPRWDKLAD